ncbi:hypothetical protein CDAR_538091, partial [Caerostris darwini]
LMCLFRLRERALPTTLLRNVSRHSCEWRLFLQEDPRNTNDKHSA